ncbi:VENN motif pre-toxin domain-containing protein, partial [Arsenophonus apicola]|uniref:VENN motif pre-toxin domain-containing protein n=1 Tax=Arsenophonus apicola TaxID=2879119 RepID=UPI00387A36AB
SQTSRQLHAEGAHLIAKNGQVLGNPGKLLSHGAMAALSAEIADSDKVGAAAGAFAAELAAIGFGNNYYVDSSNRQQKILDTSRVIGGLAGALASGTAEGAYSGADAGVIAVQNNFLSASQVLDLKKELEEADKSSADKQEIIDKYQAISEEQRAEMVANCSQSLACSYADFALMEGGTDIAKALNRFAGFSDLSIEDRNLLVRFVTAENELSATALYQALPTTVKAALHSKEALTESGLGAAIGGSAMAALGAIAKKPAIDSSIKISTGITVGEFEKSLVGLPPGEKVAIVKRTSQKVAAANGLVKDSNLTKKNNRDVYRGTDGNLYALDTQHGRFEVVSSKGKHLGEVDFSFQKIPDSIDKSGGHNLKVK